MRSVKWARSVTTGTILVFLAICSPQIASPFWHGALPSCAIAKNINTDFGAVGSGLVDDGPAFVGTGSFRDWALNTYQPANPGATICLTLQASNRYFFGTFSDAIFDGIQNLIVNANGAAVTNALNLATTSGTAAGNNVLTFASVPAGVRAGFPVLDLTHSGALVSLTVASVGANTVTLSGNVSAPGVSSGDMISFAGGGFFLGTQGQVNDAAHNAAVLAVSAGATCATLSNSALASIFSSGGDVIISGVDQQGFGYPQNLFFWEYVVASNVDASHKCDGITAGASVHFSAPVQYSYETTWPQYNAGCNTGGGGGCPTINLGGPATLYVMPASWNVNQVYNNLTVDIWSGGTLLNSNGKSITCNSCSFVNWGLNFSQQKSLVLNNPDLSSVNRTETDKMWAAVTINGGTVDGFFIQSGGMTGMLTLNNVHVNGSISGAPANMVINNSTVDGGWQAGAVAYGQTGTATCSNSSIAGGISLGGFVDNLTSNVGVTMSGGLITFPLSVEKPVTWAAPTIDMFFSDSQLFGVPFSVSDVTGDATNTYIQTSLAGGFPASLSNHNVRVAPSRAINFSGCSGSTTVVDWSQAGARNAKPYTYSNRIYTCTNNVATIQAANPGVPVIDLNNPPSNEPEISRAISSLVVNVSRAETTTAVNLHLGGVFDNYPVLSSAGAVSTWGSIVNLKTAGTRSYNGSTSTWSGLQTGDTLPTVANPTYMTGPMTPSADANLSGEPAGQCPIVTVTVQTL